MSELTVEVQRREQTGKNANRRLRGSGLLPAVVYGGNGEPTAIQVKEKDISVLLRTGGENSVFLLKLEGTKQERHTMIRELQQDPRTGSLIHIDFQRVDMKEAVRVKVPIQIVGIPEGVKNEGGMLDFVTRELLIECLPRDIPAEIPADVDDLHIGQHLEAKDLPLPEKVILIDEPQRVIVSVAAARVVEEEAVEEEEALLLETESAEPEVIGKGKEEEEEGA